MMHRALIRAALALVFAAALVVPARADDPPLQPDADARARAQELNQEGLRHYELAEYDAAIRSFRDAYELAPTPGLLFNIAQAYRLQGAKGCASAIRVYRSYLRLLPSASNRTAVEGHIHACEELLARMAPPPSPPPAGGAAPKDAPRARRWPALLLAGAGAAAAGGGLALYISSGTEYSRLEDQCPGGGCREEEWASYRTRERVGIGLMAAGGAAAAAGVLWWVLFPTPDEAAPRVTVAPGLARVDLAVAF